MLDEAEHFRHNRSASVATLRTLFAFGPECRSRSLRNQCSPSAESSEDAAGLLWLVRNDGLKRRGDWLPIEKAADMRVVYSEPGLSREQRADLGLDP